MARLFYACVLASLFTLFTAVQPVSMQDDFTFAVNVYRSDQFVVEKRWNQLLTDFAQKDPDLTSITLAVNTARANNPDCIYQTYNTLNWENLDALIPVETFLADDPNFDPTDYPQRVLQNVQRAGVTWFYPMDIQPLGIWTPGDVGGMRWLPDDLTRDLQARARTGSAPPLALLEKETGITLLLATYGGIPIDTRTSPPTVDFTSQKMMVAVEQVLSLINSGLMRYDEILSFTSTYEFDASLEIDWMTHNYGGRRATQANLMPMSNVAPAVAYELGVGIIPVGSRDPDACYRLLRYVAQSREVLFGLPVTLSSAGEGNLAQLIGQDKPELYTAYAQMLDSSRTVFIAPVPDVRFSYAIKWLYRALDQTVVYGGDLSTELANAETFAQAYVTCAAQIEPRDDSQLTPNEYRSAMDSCASQVDENTGDLFYARG